MRSIRRSLIGYFVVLSLIALATVGVVVEMLTREVIEARRVAATNLIETQYKDRRREEADKLDEQLLDRARLIANHTQSKYFTGFREEIDKINQWYFYLPYTILSDRLAGPLQAGWVEYVMTPGPGSVYGELTRQVTSKIEIDQSFLTDINDHDHFQDLYQVNTSRNNHWLSKSLNGHELPQFDRTAFTSSLFKFDYDNVTLYEGTNVRRVILSMPYVQNQRFIPGGGGPGRGGGRGGGGRGGPDRNPPLQGPPAAPRPDETIRMTPRYFVQAARPLDSLKTAYEQFESDRQYQLDELNDDTSSALTRVRLWLFGISGAAVVALLLGSLILTRRGLKPLDRLTAAVSQVSERDFQLPVKVEELSTELAPVHARITDTLDALKRAFEREKQSVADISHELRTPIAALGVTLDVALKKPRTPEQYKETLAECRNINNQLAKLVERIMTLASLDAGMARSAATEIDAADLAAGCATVIKPLAEAHGVTLSTAFARPLPIKADADMLREVLINLLHNAVEYNRPGGIIELSATHDNGSGVTFGVRDTGIGMTPDVRARIFERFYRADPSRTATGVHAGLGLAIVKEYVSRLHGTIAVDSTRPTPGPPSASPFRSGRTAPRRHLRPVTGTKKPDRKDSREPAMRVCLFVGILRVLRVVADRPVRRSS